MKKFLTRSFFISVLLAFMPLFINAQEVGVDLIISGSTSPSAGQVKTYTILPPDGVTIYAATWSVSRGTIQSQSTNSATILWTTAGPHGSVTYNVTSSSSGTMQAVLTFFVGASTSPNPPASPTILSQNCSSAILQKTGTIPSGETWYWQGTNSSGTSTSQSATTNYSATASGTYYIKAKNNSSGSWSTSSSVAVTLGTLGGDTWYADTDGDGLGDSTSTLISCSQPVGYVSNNSDQCPAQHGEGSLNGCPPSPGVLSKENYVYTLTAQKPTSDIGLLLINQRDSVIEHVTYFDGLGRAAQQINIRQSSTNKDIITHIEYDSLGRQSKEYLPYVDANVRSGLFQLNALDATQNFYDTSKYQNTINPYSQKGFDGSPFNKIVEQTAPGDDWKMGTSFSDKGYSNGHTIKIEYDSNIDSEIKKYSVSTAYANNTYAPTLVLNSSSYLKGELYKTITKDENWQDNQTYLQDHTTEEFKNKQGQVILKRTYNNNQKHDTYYVYDDYGNLSYVLPPKSEASTDKPNSTELSELCYQYTYDNRNRLVEKKIPGKGWEYIIYDNLDRPVLTQDVNQRDKDNNGTITDKDWIFTKYDKLGRVAYTGVYVHSSVLGRYAMQSHFNSQNNIASEYYESKVSSGTGVENSYYTNNNFPSSSVSLLTVNYYDNYSFDRTTGIGTTAVSYGINSTTNTKGLATGSKVKILDTSNWITTINYYDEKARPIYVFSKNDFLQTTDIVKSDLDFTGKTLETTATHTKVGSGLSTFNIYNKFYYDHAGRLTKQTQWGTNISGTEVIVNNTYDELGQLKSKGVGGKTTQSRLQTIDYTYNVRGWLTNINQDSNPDNDLFNFTLRYNSPTSGTALYNGNISQTSWNTLNTDSSTKTYTYSYDALNRITGATDNTTYFNLSGITYDKNGNIESLIRKGQIVATPNLSTNYGFGTMDNLSYTYDSGNKLKKVTDIGNTTYGFKDGANITTEYTYDANGNMLTDANKGITGITYNYLNLPKVVTIGGQNITYTYDATGTKLRKVVGSTTTDYAGNYVYENNTLQFFNQPEGYVKNNSGTFSYVYQYKDHLGNIRLSYSDSNNNGSINASTEIIEENNYYPFGLKMRGFNNAVTSNGNSLAQKKNVWWKRTSR